MPCIAYVEKRFSKKCQAIIDHADKILREYNRQGITLTLRQLYYQFVARDLFANTQQNYKMLSIVVSDARLAGLIDWNLMIDRTRHLQSLQHFDDGKDALNKLAGWYHIDMWKNQKVHPEVWIEKDAAIGVIIDVCQKHDVPYFSCRGFTSQTEMWRGGRRIKAYAEAGYEPFILHLGDHDPSGIDMTRDIKERIAMFTEGAEFRYERLALNMDQIQEYGPPPNPTKMSDPRAGDYVAEHGEECWELDALEPSVVIALIETHIESLKDDDTWDEDLKCEDRVKKRLIKLAKNWKERK